MGKEKPIQFSGPMVRAILEGRKTQTRRIMKPQPEKDINEIVHGYEGLFFSYIKQKYGQEHELFCRYGGPGTQLWVKEAWRVQGRHADKYSPSEISAYRCQFGRIDYEASITWNKDIYGKLRSARFMPRSISRITLEVTTIRAERLQEINSDEYKLDVFHEGICETCDHEGTVYPSDNMEPPEICGGHGGVGCHVEHMDLFRELWDSINAKRGFGWDTNPWVWVIEFKKVDNA